LANKNNSEPKKPLYGMFTDIPPHYDLINHLITLRMDRGWRRKAALACLIYAAVQVIWQ
jgi:ubiquinone/menaquinone biosynthesis C-methylase UbiE